MCICTDFKLQNNVTYTYRLCNCIGFCLKLLKYTSCNSAVLPNPCHQQTPRDDSSHSCNARLKICFSPFMVFKQGAYFLVPTRLVGWNPETMKLPWFCHQHKYGKTEQDDLLQQSRFFGPCPFWRCGHSRQLAGLISSRTHKAKNVDMKDKRDWKPTRRLCNPHENCDSTLVIF